MSHTCMSHVTHMYESRHTHVWVTSHTCMSRVTHMYDSCQIHVWVKSHTRISLRYLARMHSSTLCVFNCDKNESLTREIIICALRNNAATKWTHALFCFARRWMNHMCDMTHSYVWHDSFVCVPWLIHIIWMNKMNACTLLLCAQMNESLRHIIATQFNPWNVRIFSGRNNDANWSAHELFYFVRTVGAVLMGR